MPGKLSLFIACLCLGAATGAVAEAGQPVVSRLLITDVTPVSFSAIWISSESSTCSLRVFDGQGQQLTQLAMVSESAAHPPAEELGVMKVRVDGLGLDTAYSVQTVTTSKADGKVTVYPDQPLSVHTEKSAAPIDNSVLVRQIFAKNGANADGALLVIKVAGSSSPVTGWVGQYEWPPSPWAPADLSNVYSAVTHTPLEVRGGESMGVEGYGGKLGYALLQETVPTPTQDVFIPLNPPLVLNPKQGLCSSQGDFYFIPNKKGGGAVIFLD